MVLYLKDILAHAQTQHQPNKFCSNIRYCKLSLTFPSAVFVSTHTSWLLSAEGIDVGIWFPCMLPSDENGAWNPGGGSEKFGGGRPGGGIIGPL